MGEDEDATAFVWWIPEEIRKRLEALPVDKRDLPQSRLGPGSRRVSIAEWRCALSFVPPILRLSEDERWRVVADDVEEYGLGSTGRGLAAGEFGRTHGYSSILWEKLLGYVRPSTFTPDEIAGAIFLAVESRYNFDPEAPANMGGRLFSDVPPLLAPIYALAAGVDERIVHEKATACVKALRKAELEAYEDVR